MINWIKFDGTPWHTPSNGRMVYVVSWGSIQRGYYKDGDFYHQEYANDINDQKSIYIFTSRIYQVTYWCEVEDLNKLLPKDDS